MYWETKKFYDSLYCRGLELNPEYLCGMPVTRNFFLMKVKEESEKLGLKLNIQNTNIMASGPITSVQFSSIQPLSHVRLFENP